jgi:hypothetical protein
MKLLADLILPGANGESLTVTDAVSTKFPNIASVFAAVLQYVYVIAGIGLLVVILSSGFTLLTSAGDVKAMEKGKKGLTNGIVGFIIIFVSYWLVQLAGIIFGIQDITTIFK